MERMVARFALATDGDQVAEHPVQSVAVTSALNRGVWVDIQLERSMEGVPRWTSVVLKKGGRPLGPELLVLRSWRGEHGERMTLRTQPAEQRESFERETTELQIFQGKDLAGTWELIHGMADKLGLPFHDDGNWVDLQELGNMDPCNACLPVPAGQPPAVAFAELLGAIGQETPAVQGWTRIAGTEGYLLTGGEPGSGRDLYLDEWTMAPVPDDFGPLPQLGHAMRLKKRLKGAESFLEGLFDAAQLGRLEGGGGRLVPLVPGTVRIDHEPWLISRVRTLVNVGDEVGPEVEVQLDLVAPVSSVSGCFVPRTYILIGEITLEGGGGRSAWCDGRRLAVKAPLAPQGLPGRCINWRAIGWGGGDTEDERDTLTAYVAAPFAPRKDDIVAIYDRWQERDLVVFQAATFQSPVILGAFGRGIEKFESDDTIRMQGRYVLEGTLQVE